MTIQDCYHIETTEELTRFCEAAKTSPILCLDTEFLREKTYFPQLCLIQVATRKEAATIDPLSKQLDLSPLLELLRDNRILKIMHSARQDLEIFHQDFQTLPSPLFDTQIAGMVCGFGEQVGYGKLVEQALGKLLDKSQQFTDWSRRPLREKQIHYALADVLYLPDLYDALCEQLNSTGRTEWIIEETERLLDVGLYSPNPQDAWRKLKLRLNTPRYLAIVQALAEWREAYAVKHNIPRGWVLKDDTLLEMAIERPKTAEDMGKLRVPPGRLKREGRMEALDVLAKAIALQEEDLPKPVKGKKPPPKTALTDLLKLLLKWRAEEHGVASKLIASAEEMEQLAADDTCDIAALHGWRYQLFGRDALRLKRGEITLACDSDGNILCLERDI